jgi:AraC-like DNA-binding protein
MLYQAQEPGGALAPYVKCLWRLRGTAGEIGPQPIVPDGSFELIAHLGEPFVENGVYAGRQPRLLLAATLTRTVVVAAAGEVDVVGVRFKPGGAYPFLAVSPVEVVDTVSPALDTVARDLAGVIGGLEPGSTADLFARVEAGLCARLDRAGSDPGFDRLVAALVGVDGAPPAALASAAGQSLRQFERRFKSRVGVSAKSLQRVVRFHRAASQLLAGSPALVDVALDSGFFDQSHMSHEFRALADVSPGRYSDRAGELDRLFAGL